MNITVIDLKCVHHDVMSWVVTHIFYSLAKSNKLEHFF